MALLLGVFALSASCLGAASADPETGGTPPNIIFILADDLDADYKQASASRCALWQFTSRNLLSLLQSCRIGLLSCLTFASVSVTLGPFSLITLRHSLSVDLRARLSWLVDTLTILVSLSEVRFADNNQLLNHHHRPVFARLRQQCRQEVVRGMARAGEQHGRDLANFGGLSHGIFRQIRQRCVVGHPPCIPVVIAPHTCDLVVAVAGLENHPVRQRRRPICSPPPPTPLPSRPLPPLQPSGWSHYGGLAQTYTYFSATQWVCNVGEPCQGPVSRLGVHQSEFIGQQVDTSASLNGMRMYPLLVSISLCLQAVTQMGNAVNASMPFFLHLTPLMVHWGSCYQDHSSAAYDDPLWEMSNLPCPGNSASNCSAPISACPTLKNKHYADNLTNPHVPSWNTTAAGDVPPFMVGVEICRRGGPEPTHSSLPKQVEPPLSPWQQGRQNMGYRNRTAAVIDLDDMIGVVLDGLEALGDTVVS